MYKDLILKILEATDYKGDKDEFINDFMRIISSQALVNLVQTLPEDKQLEADKKIAAAGSQEDFSKAVSEYFDSEKVQASIDEASQNAISEWLRSVAPTLKDEQKKKLFELSEELQKTIKK